jgi:parvulin-like peptidyl-prolyl isomerase
MRDSMPVILFGLLIAFLITIVFEWGMDYLGMKGGQSDTIGKVNGHTITYKEFSEVLKNFSDNAKAQTGQEPDEAMMRQLRDQTWESILNERLIGEEVKRLGISVSDQELRDWVFGENPPEDLRKNFTDSTGTFNKELYEQVLANPNQYIQDPRGEDPNFGVKRLQEFERQLRLRRINEKLQSVVLSAVRVTEGELHQRFADQNQRYEASYALFDPNVMVKDGDVTVTDADLHEYFDENIDQYKFEAIRKLKYALFLENASAADTAGRRTEIEDAASKAKAGVDFLQLVYTYSDRPDSGAFFRRGELSEEMDRAAFSGVPGSVVGPIEDGEGFHLLKVLEERKSKDEYIHASHILIPLSRGPDSAAEKTTAQEIARRARGGEDFAQLARQYSKDASNARNGGELPWFTKGRMVPEFEIACFRAKTGEIVGPVRTPFGLHIIKVNGRDNRELKLATINAKVGPSSQTKNDVFDRAKDFAYNARESEFTREAQQIGLELKETQIQEKGGMVPGIGVNEGIVRWAFGARVGAVSDPYTITNGYAVFAVAEAKDAGVKPFDEVKESLRPLALRKVKLDRAKTLAAAARGFLAPGDTLAKLARADGAVSIGSTGSFTFTSSLPGIGRDQNFMGAAAGLQPGEISPPVMGARGAYLIQLTEKSKFDTSTFVSQKEILRARLMQEKKNRFLTDWIAKLKEKADIEDKRDIFFR